VVLDNRFGMPHSQAGKSRKLSVDMVLDGATEEETDNLTGVMDSLAALSDS
jgi:hypothetical protein